MNLVIFNPEQALDKFFRYGLVFRVPQATQGATDNSTQGNLI